MRFQTNDLLSKWGFEDGDILGYHNGVDDHPALLEIARRFVLPKIHQRVAIRFLKTIHNPVRATHVDGLPVEEFWYGDGNPPKLTPEFVDVDDAVVESILKDVKFRYEIRYQ